MLPWVCNSVSSHRFSTIVAAKQAVLCARPALGHKSLKDISLQLVSVPCAACTQRGLKGLSQAINAWVDVLIYYIYLYLSQLCCLNSIQIVLRWAKVMSLGKNRGREPKLFKYKYLAKAQTYKTPTWLVITCELDCIDNVYCLLSDCLLHS